MKIKIRLDTIKDAQALSNIAQDLSDEITITDNSGLRVSAKSVLGVIYALEFNELWLESDDDHYFAFMDFVTE